MGTKAEMLLRKNGWRVICESPFELEHLDGDSRATGRGAQIVLEYFQRKRIDELKVASEHAAGSKGFGRR